MTSQKEIHENAVRHLFWEIPSEKASLISTKLCLIHSEVSEALEALRNNDVPNLGEELADIVIRVMDLAEYLNINLEKEIDTKHKLNISRPIKHNKLF